jgi:hypothetical protein
MRWVRVQAAVPENRCRHFGGRAGQRDGSQSTIGHQHLRHPLAYDGNQVGLGEKARRAQVGRSMGDVTREPALREPAVEEARVVAARRDLKLRQLGKRLCRQWLARAWMAAPEHRHERVREEWTGDEALAVRRKRPNGQIEFAAIDQVLNIEGTARSQVKSNTRSSGPRRADQAGRHNDSGAVTMAKRRSARAGTNASGSNANCISPRA